MSTTVVEYIKNLVVPVTEELTGKLQRISNLINEEVEKQRIKVTGTDFPVASGVNEDGTEAWKKLLDEWEKSSKNADDAATLDMLKNLKGNRTVEMINFREQLVLVDDRFLISDKGSVVYPKLCEISGKEADRIMYFRDHIIIAINESEYVTIGYDYNEMMYLKTYNLRKGNLHAVYDFTNSQLSILNSEMEPLCYLRPMTGNLNIIKMLEIGMGKHAIQETHLGQYLRTKAEKRVKNLEKMYREVMIPVIEEKKWCTEDEKPRQYNGGNVLLQRRYNVFIPGEKPITGEVCEEHRTNEMGIQLKLTIDKRTRLQLDRIKINKSKGINSYYSEYVNMIYSEPFGSYREQIELSSSGERNHAYELTIHKIKDREPEWVVTLSGSGNDMIIHIPNQPCPQLDNTIIDRIEASERQRRMLEVLDRQSRPEKQKLGI